MLPRPGEAFGVELTLPRRFRGAETHVSVPSCQACVKKPNEKNGMSVGI
jgi:hypothetical protein